MTGPAIVVHGREEVIGGLDAVAAAAADLTEAHRRIISRLIPEVRRATPIRTGALAVSWSGGVSSTAASVESPLRYAPRMARTITTEILPATTDEIVREYEDALADAAKRAGFGVTR